MNDLFMKGVLKMKKQLVRFLSLLLAMVMCLSLTACGTKSENPGSGDTAENTQNGETATLAEELGYGYLSDYIDLKDLNLSYINSLSTVNNKLYIYGENYDSMTYDSSIHLIAMDYDGGNTQEIPLPELYEDENTNEYIQGISICPDGSGYWVVIERYTYDPDMWEDPVEIYDDVYSEEAIDETNAVGAAGVQVNLLADGVINDAYVDIETPAEDYIDEPVFENNDQSFLKKFDMQGKLLLELNLSEATVGLDYFYCQNMVQDENANLYISSDEVILSISADGSQIRQIQADDFYVMNMVASEDGTVVVNGWSYGNEDYRRVAYLLDSNGLKDLKIDGLSPYNEYVFYSGRGNTLLLSDGKSLFSLDLATGQITEVLSWLDSDINGNHISGVAADGEDKILVLLESYQPSTESMRFELGTLTKTPVSEIPVRTTLSLGATYLDSDLMEEIIRFNRQNDTYRITLNDYSRYMTEEDYDAGQKQMERDIIAGNCPDILYFGYNSNVKRLSSKGALVDLSEVISKDSGLSMEDLIPSPLRAFTLEDKLYALPLQFSMDTCLVSTRLAGDRTKWTMDEMVEIIDSMDGDAEILSWMTQADFVNMMLWRTGMCVDYGTGTCSFDSPEFIGLLHAASRFPAEIDYENNDQEDMVYVDDMQRLQMGDLLMTTYGLSSNYDIKQIKNLYIPENGISNLGYPTETGNGALVTVSSAMAISSRCKEIDGAWSFIRTLLADEYQENIWSFPVTVSAFDKKIEEATVPEYYLDENGEKVYYDSVGYIGDMEYEMGSVTKAQLDEFREYVYGADAVAEGYDEDLMEIIDDEIGAYFAGDKTAEEVAKLIQSRVSIYLAEIS